MTDYLRRVNRKIFAPCRPDWRTLVRYVALIVPLIKLINGDPIEEPTDAYGVGPGGILAVSLEGDGYKIEPVFGETKPAEVGAS